MKTILKHLTFSVLALVLCIMSVSCENKPCEHPNLTKYDGTTATCYQTGTKDYWYCSDCNTAFKDSACTQSYGASEIYPENVPMSAHSFGEGHLCGVCGAEKPYIKEIAGHTYLVDIVSVSNNKNWDDLSENVQSAYTDFSTIVYNNIYAGSKYTFGTDGTFTGIEVLYTVDDTGYHITVDRTVNGTYTQDGDTLTLTVGTDTQTFTLDDNGLWVQTQEINASENPHFDGVNVPEDLVISAQMTLMELSDHTLRHSENSYTEGYCEKCRDELDGITPVSGTTWKITSVSAGYNDDLEPSQEFEDYIESFFSGFIGAEYTFNSDGTVTSINGADSWTQKGYIVRVVDIQTGIPTPKFEKFSMTFKLMSDTEMVAIDACVLWKLDDPSIPAGYNGGAAWAVLHLTKQ